MVCIYCGHKTRIVNSRAQARSRTTWRRHHCPNCGSIFTTQERVDMATSVTFVTTRSTNEPFIREKLVQSLYESLKHRPSAITEALDLSDTVITKLLPQLKAGALTRNQVVATVSQVLVRFDKPAATAYNAFHPIGQT